MYISQAQFCFTTRKQNIEGPIFVKQIIIKYHFRHISLLPQISAVFMGAAFTGVALYLLLLKRVSSNL